MEQSEKIHPQTRLGAVHLNVAQLAPMVEYYQRLGLRVHSRTDHVAHMGAGEEALLVLAERPQAVRDRTVSGLYHFALLVPNRTDLARVFSHMGQTQIPLSGYSDHAVSEALYLSDPEGNGIEIYRDRPRTEWTYPNGVLRIVTEPLDVEALWAEGERAPNWDGFPADTRIGHIHLQVGQLAAEEHFYEQVLGFDRVARYGAQATFVSAGGYHHHVGLNTWRGPLQVRRNGLLGLEHYTIVLPNPTALDEVRQRLQAASIDFDSNDKGVSLQDPMGIGLLLTVTD
jgi:catechol 2,3-dioxygenase